MMDFHHKCRASTFVRDKIRTLLLPNSDHAQDCCFRTALICPLIWIFATYFSFPDFVSASCARACIGTLDLSWVRYQDNLLGAANFPQNNQWTWPRLRWLPCRRNPTPTRRRRLVLVREQCRGHHVSARGNPSNRWTSRFRELEVSRVCVGRK